MSDEVARLREEIVWLKDRLAAQQEMLEAEAARRIALEAQLAAQQDAGDAQKMDKG